MKRQKKFNNIIGNFNGVENITEPESLFLPKNMKGVKLLEEEYDSIFAYDILQTLIEDSRKSFEDDIRCNIRKRSFKQINSGLEDYVKSSTFKSHNLDLFKASILNALGEDILTHKYDVADENTQQIIPRTYFENVEELLKIDKSWLIKSKDIVFYQNKARYYTEKVLSEFYKNESNLEFIPAFRGQGNIHYYKNDMKNNKSDIISIFSGIKEPIPFFERQILNSYTINFVVADKFMLNRYNQRRAKLIAELDVIIENTFSSFVVSNIFQDRQFEILTLPNEKDLFIFEDKSDELSAEFHIGKCNFKNYKLPRKS